MPLFACFLNKCLIQDDTDYVVVSPDAGGTKRAKKFAEYLITDAGVASMLKTRKEHNPSGSSSKRNNGFLDVANSSLRKVICF